MKLKTIGIDLGGTSIKAGVVDAKGAIIASGERPTLAGRAYQDIIGDIAGLCADVAAAAGISLCDIPAIGAGLPGVVDRRNGKVYLTNLFWEGVPFEESFRQYIDKPVFLTNDANAAGFAEAKIGVSRDTEASVFLTLGTGVGGGVILGGKIYEGAHGVGGELGHMIVRAGGRSCNCGNSGCLERYTSSQGLIAQARELMGEYPSSAIVSLCGGDSKNLTPKIIFDAAKSGDELAGRLFGEFVSYLALGIVSYINILDPEMFVIGGGISKAGSFLLDAVRAEVAKAVLFKALPYGRIELASLGNDAGIIGAGLLARGER